MRWLGLILGTLVFAALGEGVAALEIGQGMEASLSSLLLIAFFSGAVIVAFGAIPAGLLALLFAPRRTRAVMRSLAVALSGGDSGRRASPVLGAALSGIALATTLGVGIESGKLAAESMTVPFAVALTAAITLVAFALSLTLAVSVAPRLSFFVQRIPRWLDSVYTAAFLAAALGGYALSELLPTKYAFLPALALIGAALGARFLIKPAALWIGTGVAAVVGLIGVFAIAFLDGGERDAFTETPFAATFVAFTEGATDGDGDGMSPWFLGGDCDDSDPSIHPFARDIPDNGEDEDCSGVDASTYRAPAPPAFERPSSLRDRYNIVLIMFDALRPDHLGAAGYERNTSPHTDAFLEDSTWFLHAYTNAPSTRFAMTTVFTGVDARRTPHSDLGANRFQLHAGADTIAERLNAAGYRTAGYTITYVKQHNLGLNQGFDIWDTPWPTSEWRSNYRRMATMTSDAARTFFEETPPTTPFFLFLHYRCTHDPHFRYPQWDFGEEPIDRYDSALRYCDEEFSRVLEGLDASPFADETAVIAFSDHGELFGEHGFDNHGNTLYETDVRVLMSMRVPGLEPRRVETPRQVADIAPTVLELAGLEPPEGLEGWSLLPEAVGAERPDRPIFMFTDLTRGAVLRRSSGVLEYPYKLIRNEVSASEQLFNVAEDPDETNDLLGSEAERHHVMAERLESYLAYVRE